MFYVYQRVAKQNGEVMQQTDYPLSNLIVNEEEWDSFEMGKRTRDRFYTQAEYKMYVKQA